MKATYVDSIEPTPKKKSVRYCRRCGQVCGTRMYCSHNCADKTQKFIRAYERIYGKYRNFRKELASDSFTN